MASHARRKRPSLASLVAALLFILNRCGPAFCYFADWSALANEDNEPTCVPIPRNLSLCHGIGYTKMRLPNLLDHDSMSEVSQQATSWLPLLNVQCHADSQLFLCSLFAPVCLERPIYPCRSLCNKVKSGCEGTMATYGFPWPSMLDCDKFPLDNDMCIASMSEKSGGSSGVGVGGGKSGDSLGESHGGDNGEEGEQCEAKVCNQVSTYENILDNFCQADFVVKMKIRKSSGARGIVGRKVNSVFKTWRGTPAEMRRLRKPKMKWPDPEAACCSDWLKDHPKKQPYLVMGKKSKGGGDGDDKALTVTFVLPWSRSKDMKRARRMFKQIDCDNLPQTTKRMVAEAFASPKAMYLGHHGGGGEDPNSRRKRRRTRHHSDGKGGGKRRKKTVQKRRKVDATNIWQF